MLKMRSDDGGGGKVSSILMSLREISSPAALTFCGLEMQQLSLEKKNDWITTRWQLD